MYSYRLFEKKILSDLEFPFLVKDDSAEAADLLIESGAVPQDVLEQAVTKEYHISQKRCWLSNLTTWLIVENGSRITYLPKDCASVMKLRNYIMGFGISMAAFQRGEPAMHCSSISRDGGAILIAGKSGSGKSTLTASFLDAGYTLMADDMTLLEPVSGGQVMAKPAFPYQKLCRDAALKKNYNLEDLLYINESKDKFLVPYKGFFSLNSMPVRALFILGTAQSSTLEIAELKGLDKFHACAQNLFLTGFLGPRCYEPHMGQKLLQVAASIPIYVIIRPSDIDTTKELSERCLALSESHLNAHHCV